jgi:hypothetical protein
MLFHFIQIRFNGTLLCAPNSHYHICTYFFRKKIGFGNKLYLGAPSFFCRFLRDEICAEGEGRASWRTRANSEACAHSERCDIKYILNLYSASERRAAQPTLPSRRNTKFPYSDAPRQKLTLLRFIDPQYCVPPREAPTVLLLRARWNVHRFAPSRIHI